VPGTAIGDGLITEAEITDYRFSDMLATFAPPSTLFSANIPVDPTTGAMIAGPGIVIGEAIDLLVLPTGPGVVVYLRDRVVPASGTGTWSVIPEPSSVTLMVVGIAGLAGASLRPGWCRPVPPAFCKSADALP
jgi:hypothetical protein